MEVMSHSSSFLIPAIPPDQRSSLTYALVVLNQSLPRFVPLLWNHEQHNFACVPMEEPIASTMNSLCSSLMKMLLMYKPDVIKGDMDSIRTEVLDFYTNNGTKIMDESDDQDTTDLHKCVSYICDFAPNLDKSSLCILVAGALGGRFDHEMGNINVLCRFSSIRIVLLSDDCLIHLLPRTHHHEIHIQSSTVGPHCGLIPVGMPSGSTTTTGLEWDLLGHSVWDMIDGQTASTKQNETEMRFGGLISTSNIVKGEKITVRSDTDLLWTISIKKLQTG
ncbi:hypothetical protein FEM48_Zijuj09G0024500 [Ziziphus jujuba var. spinosa]|uniref:thiamine diphosphokinase n=1 Tax=Ziziphus jujuba var. spinosa TaxID=714518 RepID=A0A978UQD2_ZIZJJ|nr:hypothetical protein FEM48_Zijuj09G0024500 [Ziziphus jujuba var. spinosa]